MKAEDSENRIFDKKQGTEGSGFDAKQVEGGFSNAEVLDA